MKLAFRNCCKIAAFTPAAVDSDAYHACGWTYTIENAAGNTLYMNGGGLPRKAEARKESDGWRSLEIKALVRHRRSTEVRLCAL